MPDRARLHWHRRALGLSSLWLGAAPILLAGLLPFDQALDDRWCWSGAWIFPVGDPFDFTRPDPDSTPPYRANRVLLGKRGRRHSGADLSNQQGGGPVRAAAHGLVTFAGNEGGYGEHVVLAHRLPGGATAYSIYAHLEHGSIRVQAGDAVAAGTLLGRVGDTGRASAPHLHFELRTTTRPDERWEKARVRDPIVFVRERLPEARGDSTWAEPYLLWAEQAGLIDSAEATSATLTRAAWWRMLCGAARGVNVPLEAPAESLRAGLVGAGVEIEGDPQRPPRWSELARDLQRAAGAGLRLPEPAVAPAKRAADCRRMLGREAPARELPTLRRLDGQPGVAAACLLLADLACVSPGLPTAGRSPSR